MVTDPRHKILKERLQSLTKEQLKRLLDYPEEMIMDEFNYVDGRFCPLAVAFDLPKLLEGQFLNNEVVRSKVEELGNLQMDNFQINPTKGIKGSFYTDNRKEDLLNLVCEILGE